MVPVKAWCKMKVKQIGKYSVDIDVDHSVNINDELADMFAKELQKEIDREITEKIQIHQLEKQGWTKIKVKDYKDITDDWCKQYIKNRYACFGHYWFFEDQRDANYFILKWGSS